MYAATLAFAFTGEDGRTEALTGDLSKKYPEDTLVQFNFLPTLRARLALSRQNAPEALAALRAAKPYELGVTTFSPVRLLAMYLRMLVNEPIAVLARLRLARSYALEAQSSRGADAIVARAKARAAHQNFLCCASSTASLPLAARPHTAQKS